MATCPKCSSQIEIAADAPEGSFSCQVCGGSIRLKPPRARERPADVKKTKGPAAGERVSRRTPPKRLASESADLTPGVLFAGRFKVIRKLGRGTFGRVYHALDEQEYRHVALKVPRDDVLLNGQFMKRFRAEAAILKGLSHPCIVTYYGAQLDKHPRYLVAELVDGRDLEHEFAAARKAGRWVDRGRAIKLVHRLAGALQHAHRKGVIHRDVKPANILVGEGIVKLTDFGLARFGDPKLTVAGAKMGTPYYMSPEQVVGDPDGVDARADQYGLGVVLFELLVGRTPFEGRTAESVYPKILNDPLPKLLDLDPTIPPELAAICEKALSRRREDRYPDCAAFEQALRPWLPKRSPKDSNLIDGMTPDGGVLDDGFDDDVDVKPPGAFSRWFHGMGSKLGRGKTTLDPIVGTVRPLTGSLKTTFWLVARRLPGGTNWLVGWLTNRVDRLNDRLARDQPEWSQGVGSPESPQSPLGSGGERPPSGPSPKASSRPEPRRPTASVSGSLPSTGPIPLASRGATWPGHTNQGISALPPVDTKLREAYQALEAARADWTEQRREEATAWLERVPAESRGWEWAYLAALTRTPITTFGGHNGEVGAIAFDPSGRLLAAGEEGGVRVWDTSEGRALGKFSAHHKRVDAVAISPDGRWLASAAGKAIRVWDLDLPGGDPMSKSLQGHDAAVTRLAFAPDGVHLASAARDHSVRVWDFREAAERHALIGPDVPAHALAFDPGDPTGLFVGYGNGTLVLWDWARQYERRRGATRAGAAIDDLAVHPDGRLVATGGRDGVLTFWDFETLRPVSTFKAHAGPVSSLAFHPGGRWVATLGGGGDRTLRVGLATAGPGVPISSLGQEVAAVPFGASSLSVLAFSPRDDGRLALAGGHDHTVKLWDGLAFWDALAARRPGGDRAHAVAIHPAGRHWAVARPDGSVEVHNAHAGSSPRVFVGREGVTIHALAFRPGHPSLVSADNDGMLTVRDLTPSGDLAASAPGLRRAAHPKAVLALAFDPDGRLLATAGLDGSVRLWDARTHDGLHTLSGDDEQASAAVAFGRSQGVLRLFSGGSDRMVHIWDIESGEFLRSLAGHQRKVVALYPSDDPNRLVSVGEDRAVIVWDLDRLEPTLVLRDVDVLAGLAWHPSASLVVAIAEDRSLILETPLAGDPG